MLHFADLSSPRFGSCEVQGLEMFRGLKLFLPPTKKGRATLPGSNLGMQGFKLRVLLSRQSRRVQNERITSPRCAVRMGFRLRPKGLLLTQIFARALCVCEVFLTALWNCSAQLGSCTSSHLTFCGTLPFKGETCRLTAHLCLGSLKLQDLGFCCNRLPTQRSTES